MTTDNWNLLYMYNADDIGVLTRGGKNRGVPQIRSSAFRGSEEAFGRTDARVYQDKINQGTEKEEVAVEVKCPNRKEVTQVLRTNSEGKKKEVVQMHTLGYQPKSKCLSSKLEHIKSVVANLVKRENVVYPDKVAFPVNSTHQKNDHTDQMCTLSNEELKLFLKKRPPWGRRISRERHYSHPDGTFCEAGAEEICLVKGATRLGPIRGSNGSPHVPRPHGEKNKEKKLFVRGNPNGTPSYAPHEGIEVTRGSHFEAMGKAEIQQTHMGGPPPHGDYNEVNGGTFHFTSEGNGGTREKYPPGVNCKSVYTHGLEEGVGRSSPMVGHPQLLQNFPHGTANPFSCEKEDVTEEGAPRVASPSFADEPHVDVARETPSTNKQHGNSSSVKNSPSGSSERGDNRGIRASGKNGAAGEHHIEKSSLEVPTNAEHIKELNNPFEGSIGTLFSVHNSFLSSRAQERQRYDDASGGRVVINSLGGDKNGQLRVRGSPGNLPFRRIEEVKRGEKKKVKGEKKKKRCEITRSALEVEIAPFAQASGGGVNSSTVLGAKSRARAVCVARVGSGEGGENEESEEGRESGGIVAFCGASGQIAGVMGRDPAQPHNCRCTACATPSGRSDEQKKCRQGGGPTARGVVSICSKGNRCGGKMGNKREASRGGSSASDSSDCVDRADGSNCFTRFNSSNCFTPSNRSTRGNPFTSKSRSNAEENRGARHPERAEELFPTHLGRRINSNSSVNMLANSSIWRDLRNGESEVSRCDGVIPRCREGVGGMTGGMAAGDGESGAPPGKWRNEKYAPRCGDDHRGVNTDGVPGEGPSRERVNLPSNDEDALNSFDVTYECSSIAMGEDEQQAFSSNDILVRDIEEFKMDKFFFEEIYTYRVNERMDEGASSAVAPSSGSGVDRGGGTPGANPFERRVGDAPGNFLCDEALRGADLTKLVLHKSCYEHINDEVKNLMREEDEYQVEMNVGLMFRKYIPMVITLACNYLLIKRNEQNIITCIPYGNILNVSIVKRSKKKKDRYLFKLMYIFKKKDHCEKNVTLLFRASNMEVFKQISGKVEPSSKVEPTCRANPARGREYLTIESVHSYMVEKYKRVYLLYLMHLLQIVDRVCRRHVLRRAFIELKTKCDYEKGVEEGSKQRERALKKLADRLQFYLRKKVQSYFNVLMIRSYETNFVSYQVKTNDLLFNLLVKEKSSYQEIVDRQSVLLLFHVLSNLYKRRMSSYLQLFAQKNRTLSRRKSAVSYSLTRVNSILVNYERRIKGCFFSKLKFHYDYVTNFVFTMFRVYLRRVFLGYIRLRDNRIGKKVSVEKNVFRVVRVISRMVQRQKYYAFLQLQKFFFHQMERKNKIACDNLMYANNELCQHLDKATLEKGIHRAECFYKMKMKEHLLKYFFLLRGPHVGNVVQASTPVLRHCGVFSFVLNKLMQRKVQDWFFLFVLKTYQHNNRSRLLYATNSLEVLLSSKEQSNVMHLLRMNEAYPCLFHYRHLTKIEIFTHSLDRFVTFCNRKWLLNFLLKLHCLKYQERLVKVYRCIDSLYKFVRVVNRQMLARVETPFQLLLLNARVKRGRAVADKFGAAKKTQLKFKYSKATSSPLLAPDPRGLCGRYPYLFCNSDISPARATLTDDKYSLLSDSASNVLSYAYEDMDKIKRKIYDFNNRMSNVNL
ncbi:hypothetical protein, conserved [Plasmodium vivax]|uniref:Uncharacterized protein n=1 Tax=Plasmodium vivax (strain Salvador I) TaxID=126793 RepID=A5KBL8_PLAVS|nr:hypothetical protein, conserved [Plasmodium vivax]EDL43268.1 hypothetical protein, conserved [Plasmodium vivax]|eukprot:XP_001612995.1 hypothetical protein [Plasmodium vivax Sal-1]